ncbi:sensor histidine kinase [Pradoshia sp. D12]|uniref:sensor histidine kinase n=1 Tax=Bacillaceae TaxID=186817 RepID=UPI0011296163|nr:MULTISPECIES: sensor histidine kinase [Bacillaceae]QFK70733.1 sensor histidine kinase [Pradoshia sp. D12]TPF72527.1 sensor histidine kinase [Bacillus sp. D12]
MSILKRQLLICISISLLLFLTIFLCYYVIFFSSDWTPLYEKKIFNVPFLLFALSIALLFGVFFGIASGLFYKSEINQLNDTLRSVNLGENLSEKEIKTKELSESLEKIKQIQTVLLDQAKRSQALATENSVEQEKRVQEMVKEERNRLARELHDSVSQQLFAASMLMSAINESGGNEETTEKKQLRMVESMIQQSQLEMRALLLHLRPVHLKDKSLKEGVDNLLSELKQKIPFTVKWKVEDLELEKGIEDHLFRILQESVSNTLRHAKAQLLEVYIIQHERSLIMRVIDDGVGFTADEAKAGSYGLQNMKERAIEIGGILKVVSVPKQGTRIEVRVPLVNVGEKV